MTPEDFARIEQDLSVSLSQAYRAALMRPEFQSEEAGFQEFSGDADEIIGLNLEVWEEGFHGVKWPDHYLVIGEDGAGNNYFTDLTKERPAVFLADHEQTSNKKRLVTSETYETFADFLAFIHRLQAEVEKTMEPEEQVEAGPAKKPWWRFW
ncbi:MAG: SMI1/KNR4 family protein [Verrucomicrobiota bacterium]